jgi:hypothetical protein
MKCRSQRFKFDLPDEWWAAAGMVGFVPYRTAYRCCAVRRTMILRIDEIAVPPRGAGVPDFERDRMVSVLDAIRRDATLPPIEVVEAISDLYSHRLYHGRHRLAASIAVGFSLIPAAVVRDLDEIKRGEGMAQPSPCGQPNKKMAPGKHSPRASSP